MDANGRAMDENEQRFLEWRGIDVQAGDKPCPDCGGSGRKAYGSTTTWRGGIGGQMITSGICDKCWGSGNAEKPWTDLRRVDSMRRQLEAETGRHSTLKPPEGSLMMDLYNEEALAKLFHENYERLAPGFGYKTREASAKPWEEVPENNRKLMIAVAGEVLTKFRSQLALRLREETFLTVSERCRKQNVQCCTACEKLDCGDNLTPVKDVLKRLISHTCAFCVESHGTPGCNPKCEVHEAQRLLGEER